MMDHNDKIKEYIQDHGGAKIHYTGVDGIYDNEQTALECLLIWMQTNV